MNVKLTKVKEGYVCCDPFGYVKITKSFGTVLMDGRFTSADLRAIADKLDEVNKEEDNGNGKT